MVQAFEASPITNAIVTNLQEVLTISQTILEVEVTILRILLK